MKSMGKLIIALSVLLILAIVLFITLQKERKRSVSFGTGGITGVYYPVGGAISKILNQKSEKYNLRASVETTGGSIYNMNAVLSKELQFGIAQSDRVWAKWKEKDKNDLVKNLRTAFKLHPEAVHLVCDESVTDISQIAGKSVNVGSPGSGQYVNSEEILKSLGLYDKIKIQELKPSESASAFGDGKIDCFFYTLGIGGAAIVEATSVSQRKARIVSIEAENLIKTNPYYIKTTIPREAYPGSANESDITTIGLAAVLVTSSDVDEDIVYYTVKEVFENLDKFRKLHPALSRLTKEGMTSGISSLAPIHKGALKYFKETGINVQ